MFPAPARSAPWRTAPGVLAPALGRVLAAVRSALHRDAVAEAALFSGADAAAWNEFAADVRKHRLGAFLDRHLPRRIADMLPGNVRAALREGAEMAAFQSSRQQEALRQLGPGCAAAGVQPILVKGPLLAQQLYGDAALRLSNDLDVLVRFEEVERADALLRAAGYTRKRPDFPLTPRQHDTYKRVQYEFAYFSPSQRLQLELLWRLEGLSPPAELWAHAPAVQFAGGTWRVLPDAVNAFFLCLHGARHGWCRLAWLLDVAMLLRSASVPWPEMLALARAQGGERMVWQASSLAEQLLGVEPPGALRVPRREEPEVAWLVREACRQMEVTPEQERQTGEWLRQLRYRVRLQRGWRARVRVLQPHLHSLASWKALRLPDRLFWLYVPATPLLWLGRRLRAAR